MSNGMPAAVRAARKKLHAAEKAFNAAKTKAQANKLADKLRDARHEYLRAQGLNVEAA